VPKRKRKEEKERRERKEGRRKKGKERGNKGHVRKKWLRKEGRRERKEQINYKFYRISSLYVCLLYFPILLIFVKTVAIYMKNIIS
jgi:hypothetical protein